MLCGIATNSKANWIKDEDENEFLLLLGGLLLFQYNINAAASSSSLSNSNKIEKRKWMARLDVVCSYHKERVPLLYAAKD